LSLFENKHIVALTKLLSCPYVNILGAGWIYLKTCMSHYLRTTL